MQEFHVSVGDKYSNSRKEVMVDQLFTPEWRARLACSLIERWGMVAADQDGEDTSGRAKARLQKPSEIVNRACETADLAVSEFEKRGWLTQLPIPVAE